MSDEKTVGECYEYNKATRDKVDNLEGRHNELAARVFHKLDALEEKLVSRLPVWATILIATLTAVIGILAGMAK